MKRIPVNHFGYYFSIEPFIAGYYQVNEPEKARKIFLEVAQKYQERLEYYLTLSRGDFQALYEDLSRDLTRYRSLLLILSEEDEKFSQQQEQVFDSYIDKLTHLARRYGLLQQQAPQQAPPSEETSSSE